ncbi:MAG TPA: LLM class flavin-dependent oxidoreductase [Burkholderiales bacterium]|nr:LLM class flavin-dependent oxidoreductase [Burkholderiales bacterium]
MKLSVLDQSTASKGRTEDHAIRETLELARHCDALGYHRYWVSEHHNTGNIVGTAPEILMSAIAATTQRIRVGSAGVMLPHYSSLKVAEQFRVLEAIAPGRIDLGLGRAPGSDQRTAFALNPNTNNAEDFPQQVYELDKWVSGAPLDPRHPYHAIKAHPLGPTSPELWILGSSDYGARLAAHFGMPYAFAYFFTDGHGMEEAFHLYRAGYKPSERHARPMTAACVWALAADTEDEARRLAATREHSRILRDMGIRDALVSPEEAAAYPYTHAQRARLESMRRDAFVGTAEQVKEMLTAFGERHALDELVIVTWTYDPAPRHRSYELLAQAFGLTAESGSPPARG